MRSIWGRKMEIQIKKAVKAGNSSAVILPRAWLNKEVRIELVKKSHESILIDTINIIKKYLSLESVIGIYLVGSYARGEEDENSDIDLLVVTSNIDKEIINEGIYNVSIISKELLKENLSRDLFPIGQMIKEAKPLLNYEYLNSINVEVTKNNIRWYVDTTQIKLDLIKKVLDKYKKNNRDYVSDSVAYTLILRLRTMEIIKKMIKNKDYSKKDFISKINNISRSPNAYEGYLAVKNNLKKKNRVSLEESEKLYEYLKEELASVKKLVKELK